MEMHPETDNRTKNSWRRVALVAFGVGAGASATLLLCFGLWFWYANRPAPWDTRALTVSDVRVGESGWVTISGPPDGNEGKDDVKGLLADPDFNKLDPATQRYTLGKLDPQFASLNDEQFARFKAGMSVAPHGTGVGGKDMTVYILTSPKFQSLPTDEKLMVMRRVSPDFAGLPTTEQLKVLERTRGSGAKRGGTFGGIPVEPPDLSQYGTVSGSPATPALPPGFKLDPPETLPSDFFDHPGDTWLELTVDLQNNTAHDLTIQKGLTIMKRDAQTNALSAAPELTWDVESAAGKTTMFGDPAEGQPAAPLPFIPAKQKVKVSMSLRLNCRALKPDSCLGKHYNRDDKFVIFDHADRLQIEVPIPIQKQR